MHKILYIGNKLEKWGRTPTAVDTIPDLLKTEGFEIVTISTFQNKFLRLLEMCLYCLFGNYQKLLIDTYSTQNFIYAKFCGSIARFRGKDYYFILHGGNLSNRLRSSGNYVTNLFQTATKLVAPSEYLYQQFNQLGYENLVCFPNAVPLQNYAFRHRIHINPKLLWIRSFQELYNPELAIQVLENLSDLYPESELCMVGPDKDGSLAELKKYVKENDLKVSFPGKLSKPDLISLSHDYCVFLNTSNVDNTPVSVIEAMALGLPVVSTNVGGIPYLIQNAHTGLLVTPEDPKAMTAACIKLISQPEFSAQLAKNARIEVEKFDWQRVKQQWLDLLG
ncbi:glycosyltransferase family 4 protein [uncultured Christiangramia sp.]|uniref:glycosyltransferase family 4 protein n=1 Tax=Christiangramia sp. 3-2217-3z TaxID=3417564 RepID=UPI00261A09BE|nr:glycosyltransferase family 4 protein [uncultured Christiangramia sp.]